MRISRRSSILGPVVAKAPTRHICGQAHKESQYSQHKNSAPAAASRSSSQPSCTESVETSLLDLAKLMKLKTMFVLVTVVAILSSLPSTVNADCECGYYINSVDNSPAPILFTDVLESDFLHIRDVTLDTDWKRQNFSVTAAAGRGPYGMNFSIQNVLSNPIFDLNNWTGPGLLGGDSGVQLLVNSGVPSNGYVQSSQLNSAREDMLWGSYRAAMQLSMEPGTCAAFFWYFNDTQEIDMEFLSSQFVPENNTYPVNLVLQSQAAANAGFNAVGTGNYVVANLPFNPTDGFHEYRMDFVPGSVVFYADGTILAKMNTSAVPDMPGHMILTQWSNGNPLWSSGPPAKESVVTISYVKAYFNSSEPARQSALASRCKDPGGTGATCVIPDQNGPPDPGKRQQGNETTPSTYFFSDDKNKTVGQTIYHKSGVKSLHGEAAWFGLVMTLLPLILWFTAYL